MVFVQLVVQAMTTAPSETLSVVSAIVAVPPPPSPSKRAIAVSLPSRAAVHSSIAALNDRFTSAVARTQILRPPRTGETWFDVGEIEMQHRR